LEQTDYDDSCLPWHYWTPHERVSEGASTAAACMGIARSLARHWPAAPLSRQEAATQGRPSVLWHRCLLLYVNHKKGMKP